MTETDAIIAANAAFYTAFAVGNIGELIRVGRMTTRSPVSIPAGRPSSARDGDRKLA